MRTFFSKKSFSFSEIAPLVLETIAQILSRNSATQHFSQKKIWPKPSRKKKQNLIKTDQTWSNLIKFDQNHYFDQIWSGLIRFDQIWSVLTSFDQFFLFGFFWIYSGFFWWNLSLATIFFQKKSLKKGNLWGGKVLSPYTSSFQCPQIGDAKEINATKIVNQSPFHFSSGFFLINITEIKKSIPLPFFQWIFLINITEKNNLFPFHFSNGFFW